MGPKWEYRLGRTGGKLRIAIVYDRDWVRVKRIAELPAREFTIQGEDIFDRDPFIAWVVFKDASGEEKNDLLLVGLHLRSQQHNEDNHLAVMAKLLTEFKTLQAENDTHRAEWDVIVMGDLNDSANTLRRFRYLFDYMKAKCYTHLWPGDGEYPAAATWSAPATRSRRRLAVRPESALKAPLQSDDNFERKWALTFKAIRQEFRGTSDHRLFLPPSLLARAYGQHYRAAIRMNGTPLQTKRASHRPRTRSPLTKTHRGGH